MSCLTCDRLGRTCFECEAARNDRFVRTVLVPDAERIALSVGLGESPATDPALSLEMEAALREMLELPPLTP